MAKNEINCIAQEHSANWSLYHGDSCEVIGGLPDSSVDFCIHSPPFSSLYIYSDSESDMGNCQSDDEFFRHYEFLIKELHRVTVPGRLCAVHCKDLPKYKNRDGSAGLSDFPGMIIRAFEDQEWTYHSRVTIWKCPVTEMQRTKNHGLLHKQLCKDSSASRQGMADYLIVFRKWEDWDGITPPKPVQAELRSVREAGLRFDSYVGSMPPGTQLSIAFEIDGGVTSEVVRDRTGSVISARDMSIQVWQRYASPVWFDIHQTRVLNYKLGRDGNDEKHICLATGSLVLTREYGYLEIEDIEPGDHVLTHTGRWMPVIAKKRNGIAETIRVCGQGVADLRVTPGHKLWTRFSYGKREKDNAKRNSPDWIDAKDVLGSYLNLQLPPEEESELTEQEWWIVGRWLGDGHRGSRRTSGKRGGGLGQFIISCNHNEVDELKTMLGIHAGSQHIVTATQINLINLRSCVREVLDRCGEGAENKRLPGEAVCLSKKKSEALLFGYISADGHYVEKHDRVMASSVSRGLLLGMAIIVQRSREAVASVYAGRSEREGEIQGRSVSMMQEWIFAFRNSDGCKKSGWIDELGAWKKVRKIEDAGESEVWDLQVAEDASFTAEGCVVHNCPLQLDVIERAIHLWTNPGDVVLTPFAGIGSEVYSAVKMLRRGVGIELKDSYFREAIRNCRLADNEARKRSLLDRPLLIDDATDDDFFD